jgi:hypothetical protein
MEKNNKFIWILATLVIVVSTLINIKNQFETLETAENKNEELKIKLDQMNVLKNNLDKKIEYATTSAFVDSQRKELLGLGTNEDYWIDMPRENTEVEIIRDVYETRQETNIQKWLRLFTD